VGKKLIQINFKNPSFKFLIFFIIKKQFFIIKKQQTPWCDRSLGRQPCPGFGLPWPNAGHSGHRGDAQICASHENQLLRVFWGKR
jgi:hypothetical protein